MATKNIMYSLDVFKEGNKKVVTLKPLAYHAMIVCGFAFDMDNAGQKIINMPTGKRTGINFEEWHNPCHEEELHSWLAENLEEGKYLANFTVDSWYKREDTFLGHGIYKYDTIYGTKLQELIEKDPEMPAYWY